MKPTLTIKQRVSYKKLPQGNKNPTNNFVVRQLHKMKLSPMSWTGPGMVIIQPH